MTLSSFSKKFSDSIFSDKANRGKIYFSLLSGLVSLLITYFLIRKIDYYLGEPIKIGLIVFTMLLISLRYKTASSLYKAVYLGVLLSITFIAVQSSFKIIENNFLSLKEWDFLCFYMDGNVAARGLNFYEPQNYAEVYKHIEIPFTPGSEFIPETINVGFQYFPPNIFNFLFLGYLDFNAAHILWNILSIIFLIADIFLIWDLFFKKYKLLGLIFSTNLLLLLQGTISTLVFEHNTFIFLLPVLLFWKYKNFPSSGIWLSIAIFLKPILLIYFLYPLVRRKWKIFGVAIISSIIILLITYLTFGIDIFYSFISKNTASIVPYWVYTEWTNQSLLGTILRITNYSKAHPLFNPLYIIVASVITILTLIITYKIDRNNDSWALGIISALSLIIYPGTQPMYSPILIPVIIMIYNFSLATKKNNYLVWLIIVSFIYLIMFVNPFISYFSVWIILITLALFKTGIIHSDKITLMKFSTVNN